jgi:hypothetical protein
MSPLATAVYQVLRLRAELPEPRITYAELAGQVRAGGAGFEGVHHRSRELYAALGEVGDECRRLGLPCLAALVVRADTRRPGAAYFEAACPGTVYKGEKVAAWRRELDAVRQAAYPAR